MSEATDQQSTGRPANGSHEDRIERLNRVFYIRWTSGPDYERAFLCVEDGEPDMNEFAEVTFGAAHLFRAGMLALESLSPICPPPWFTEQFLASRHFTAAHTIDIIARKDGREYSLEGDWLKPFVAALAPAAGEGDL
jgi:hypothetical protein